MTPTEPLASRTGTALVWKSIQLVGVKLIFLLRLAILARLLQPDAFGLLAIALIPVDLFLNITDLGMIPALVQREDVDKEHYDTAWTIGLYRALVIAALVLLAAPLIAWLAGEPRATNLIRLLALGPIIEAAASIRIADLIRRLDFRSLASIDLAKALVITVVSAALALPLGVWALIVGRLAGAVTYVLASYLVAPYRPKVRVIRSAARALIRFGRWILLTSLFTVAGSAVLRLVVSRKLGVAELGVYFLAARVAFLPGEVASEVVGAVAFPVYAHLQSDLQRIHQVFRAVLTGLFAVLAPVCLLLVALAPSISKEILGPGWAGTAPVIRLLALATLLGILGEVAVPVFKGIGQPYRIAVLEGAQTLVLVVLVWWLASRHGVVGAAAAWLPAVFLSQVVCIAFLRQIMLRPFSGLEFRLLAILGASAVTGALAWLVDARVGGLEGLLLATALGALTSFLFVWLLDRTLELDLAGVVNQLFPALARVLRPPSTSG
jgi:PST family polysaccharide transporter/lipopolysaccharide exporter